MNGIRVPQEFLERMAALHAGKFKHWHSTLLTDKLLVRLDAACLEKLHWGPERLRKIRQNLARLAL